MIIEALQDARGGMKRAAHLLIVSRRTLLRYVWRENLWPLIDELRYGKEQSDV